VGALYGARASGGILDGWLVDSADADCAVPDLPVRAAPLRMIDEAATMAMVRAALVLAEESGGRRAA
jgi:LPPG:FO 2-phospho-L-lactate transferase